jgi:hypothetical protein
MTNCSALWPVASLEFNRLALKQACCKIYNLPPSHVKCQLVKGGDLLITIGRQLRMFSIWKALEDLQCSKWCSYNPAACRCMLLLLLLLGLLIAAIMLLP